MMWSESDDAALTAQLSGGASQSLIADRLTRALGRPVTRKAVEHRLARIAAKGRRTQDHHHGGGIVSDLEIPVVWDEETETTAPESKPNRGDPVDAEENAMLRRLIDFTKRKPMSLEALCDKLDVSPARVRRLIEMAALRGFRVELDGDHIGHRPHQESEVERSVAVAGAGEQHIVALVGDVHFGSRHHLREYFHDFCRIAYARGVRTFLQVGDLLDGNYRHSVWEQNARGYEEQVELAIRDLPRFHDASWHFIQGNHDETLGETNGLDVGRAIEQSFRAAGRTDLSYHGARGAYIRLRGPSERRGLLVELWHPRDRANAYAKSYRLQKKIEKYAPGSKPDLLAAGHWHQSMFMTTRGVHAISTGCWQGGQSAFGKSLGGAPDIGSWIVEYSLTSDGTVRSIRPEWVSYFENETVREVGLS